MTFPFFFQIHYSKPDDYRLHTSCITEAERYEKTIYKGPRKNDTKGRKLTVQEIWMEVINESMNTCPPALSTYLQTLSTYDNVPRKEKAFRNFASNSLKLRGAYGDDIVSSLWKQLQTVREAKTKAKENQERETKKSEENEKEGKKAEMNPVPSTACIPCTTKPNINKKKDKKTVVKAMKKVLKKAPSRQLKMKELRKLVKQRLEEKESGMSKDELKDFIIKAIDDESSITLDGKIVKLTQ